MSEDVARLGRPRLSEQEVEKTKPNAVQWIVATERKNRSDRPCLKKWGAQGKSKLPWPESWTCWSVDIRARVECNGGVQASVGTGSGAAAPGGECDRAGGEDAVARAVVTRAVRPERESTLEASQRAQVGSEERGVRGVGSTMMVLGGGVSEAAVVCAGRLISPIRAWRWRAQGRRAGKDAPALRIDSTITITTSTAKTVAHTYPNPSRWLAASLYRHTPHHPHPPRVSRLPFLRSCRKRHVSPSGLQRSLQSCPRHALPEVSKKGPLQLRMQSLGAGAALQVATFTHAAAPQPPTEAQADHRGTKRLTAKEGCCR